MIGDKTEVAANTSEVTSGTAEPNSHLPVEKKKSGKSPSAYRKNIVSLYVGKRNQANSIGNAEVAAQKFKEGLPKLKGSASP